jgi:2,4-dienoyl-CoA reductase-like NADH-dependent reductase (Old Yellow Enzyme family)
MKLNLKRNNCNLLIKLKNLIIPSRFFLAPINTSFAYWGGPTDQLLQFHHERSGKGIGVSYVGNVAISNKFVVNNRTLFFNKNLNRWKDLAYLISANGSLPGVQLACRISKLTPSKFWINPNADVYIKIMQSELYSFSTSFLKEIVNYFVCSAQIANSLGFKIIQIHSAHGYFLSQLMNRVINIRDDEFGLNKTLMLEMIINAIKKELPDIVLDIRISLLDGIEKVEIERDYKEELINRIAKSDTDIISISNGFYDINKNLIYPPRKWGHGVYIKMILPFTEKYPNKLWNIVGNIWDLRQLPHDLPSNLTFSIGRALIADPNFIHKSLNEEFEKIIVCTECNECHYYMKGYEFITCPVNLQSLNKKI